MREWSAVYRGRSREDVARSYRTAAGAAASSGYVPISETWSDDHLTVVYRFNPAEAPRVLWAGAQLAEQRERSRRRALALGLAALAVVAGVVLLFLVMRAI